MEPAPKRVALPFVRLGTEQAPGQIALVFVPSHVSALQHSPKVVGEGSANRTSRVVNQPSPASPGNSLLVRKSACNSHTKANSSDRPEGTGAVSRRVAGAPVRRQCDRETY